jgi:AcrR family transcriptional regulator
MTPGERKVGDAARAAQEPRQMTRENCISSSRRKAFVDAARDAFFAHGYAATTMSSIARAVGGSKTTLWSYFPSKEALFAAVVDDVVGRFADALDMGMPLDGPVPDVLRAFGNVLTSTLTADPFLSLYRLVVSEADRFPVLAETFYQRGPVRGKMRAAIWMEAKMARGEILPGDPLMAVEQFAALCKAGAHPLAVLGVAGARDPARLSADVDAAVALFCRAMCPLLR